MILKILIVIGAAILCGILYRLGGRGQYGNWIDKISRSWVRDWLCPLYGFGILFLWWKPQPWWLLIIAYGMTVAALSTYWDELFGYDNFWFHGFMSGLASFPLIWAGVNWYAVLISAVICSLMGAWQKMTKSDVKQEVGRGIIFCLSRLCLLI